MSDQIARAVANVRKPKAVVLGQMTINVAAEPLVVRRSGELSFTRAANADPAAATLLLFDPAIGGYRAVLTPPGSAWELVEKAQGPSVWRPGMPT
jgi:hypothetical protein